MARLYLVRHGRAAAGWGEDADPHLDAAGVAQADAMAAALDERLAVPLPIVVSPLKRTRETAAPLERRWNTAARVDPGVGELVSPIEDLAARAEWLRGFMRSSWTDAPDELKAWRARVVETMTAIDTDTVVVSHFIAINVAVGEATGDERVVCFAPDNCSITTIDASNGALSVVELGGEATTVVRVQ